MLRGLSIREMLIIDRLEIEFQAGLNVLTGETGAGKSILLDSLGFVLGWRGRAALVRQGADQGEVTAWFDIAANHPANAILSEAGFEDTDGELILRRVNTPDGRKTAYINDRRCSGDVLRRVGETLIELHGQHDDKGLLNVKTHKTLLDDYGQFADLKQACRDAWKQLAHSQQALDQRQAEIAALADEEEFLTHALDELQKLGPGVGEADALDSKRRLMRSSEKLSGDVDRAIQSLGHDGADGAMGDATRWLETVATAVDGQLDGALATLARAQNELADATAQVQAFRDALVFNPHELEEVEDRLFAIRALARKHDCAPDDLPNLQSEFAAKLDVLTQGTSSLDGLVAAVAQAQAAYDDVAQRLSAARAGAASALDQAVMDELAPLKMDRAVFQTTLEPAPPGPDGVDAVHFTVATNPGAPAGPLNKIASGGELSRFLLALKVCLTQQNAGLSLIFDEIDRGVGGATADAVGRRLHDLARGGQVLVVTHSPQVAALGNAHWQVEKKVTGDQTLSTVTRLQPGDRIDEIARMISGDVITDQARAAAQALLGS